MQKLNLGGKEAQEIQQVTEKITDTIRKKAIKTVQRPTQNG